LHRGHLGCCSSPDSITYIRHCGHPTTTIGFAGTLTASSVSDDKHELAGESIELLPCEWLMHKPG
jgi:hypothetical protein